MNLVLLLCALIALLHGNLLDAIAASFSSSETYKKSLNTIIGSTGLPGFAVLCFASYVLGSVFLLGLRDHFLRLPYVQSTVASVMDTFTHETLLSVVDLLCATFAAFGLGYVLVCHNVFISRLSAGIYGSAMSKAFRVATESSYVYRITMSIFGPLWPIVNNSVLLLGTLNELSRLSGESLSLLAFSVFFGVFIISACFLAFFVATFVLELGCFLAIQSSKSCISSLETSGALSSLSILLDELYLFIYLSDGQIDISSSDIPKPRDTSVLVTTTTTCVVRHVRSASCGTNSSKATQGSSPTKISIQNSAVSKDSRATSLQFSGESTDASRPDSRSSHPTTVSDLDQCIQIVDSCLSRIHELESENQILRKNHDHARELELDNEMLRARDEHYRRDRLQDERKFQGLLKGIEFLEAANADLLEENHSLHQKLNENEEEGNTCLKSFVKTLYPQHLDLFSDLDPSAPAPHSSPKTSPGQPITPRGERISIERLSRPSPRLPKTPSSGPSLPFSPRTPVARSLGHISPTSLIKPLHPRTPTGPGLPTPEAMKREFNPRVKIVVPRCPTTVSSRNSLPCPTTVGSNTSSSNFLNESAARSRISSPSSLKKRYPQGIPLFPAGPGLPCPMRLVFGDRIPHDSSPTEASDDTPLPCPTTISAPSSFGRVSINSLNRPYFGGHVESPLANRRKNVDLFSPLSRGAMHDDAVSSIDSPRYKTPAAKARAKRFSNFLDFERSPSYVSSDGSPLPAPPQPSYPSSDYDPFI